MTITYEQLANLKISSATQCRGSGEKNAKSNARRSYPEISGLEY